MDTALVFVPAPEPMATLFAAQAPPPPIAVALAPVALEPTPMAVAC